MDFDERALRALAELEKKENKESFNNKLYIAA
jgi:hypothetical protein